MGNQGHRTSQKGCEWPIRRGMGSVAMVAMTVETRCREWWIKREDAMHGVLMREEVEGR